MPERAASVAGRTRILALAAGIGTMKPARFPWAIGQAMESWEVY